MPESVDPARYAGAIAVYGASHRGLVRSANEDSYLARFPFAIVADGMGGHQHGARASSAVVAAFEALADREPLTVDEVLGALEEANRALVESAAGAVSGTTVAGVVLVASAGTAERHWLVLNVGDSRVYRWDGRRLAQLSVDHSVVQELLDASLITQDEAATHPDRNVITRAVGSRADLDVDIWLIPADGDAGFLVCSDGLTKELGDEQIASILTAHRSEDGRSVADALVEAALAVGARDNVTAVVVEPVTAGTATSPTGTRPRQLLEDTRPRG